MYVRSYQCRYRMKARLYRLPDPPITLINYGLGKPKGRFSAWQLLRLYCDRVYGERLEMNTGGTILS